MGSKVDRVLGQNLLKARIGEIWLNFAYHRNDTNTFNGALSTLKNDKFHFNQIDFKEGDVFLDIGCNIGLISSYAYLKFPFIKCYGYDASDDSAYIARLNYALNDVDGEIFNKAVGVCDGTISFRHNKSEVSCFERDDLQGYENPSDLISVEAQGILSILDQFDKVKYLKVDIEGGEHDVFNFLLDQHPEYFDKIEYLHLETHSNGGDCEILENKIKEVFGERVFFDA